MTQKKRKKKTSVKIPPRMMIVAGVVLALLLILMIGGNKKNAVSPLELQAGLNFLEQQEKKNPDTVRQTRKALYVRRMEEQKDELLAAVDSGDLDPFTLFQNYAVLGDSRGVGFYFWGFMPEDRVLADAGNTIRTIPDKYEALKELQPSYVYLCFGINDCGIGFWSTGEEYAAEYVETVRELQAILPEATIIVSSIPPAQDPAFEQSTDWYNIPDWNVAVEAACKEAGILYANCDSVFEEHSDLYDIDGIHFLSEIYPYWAGELIVTALYGGVTNET